VHDHENRIISWSALSIPHLQAFGQAIMNDSTQRKMSQYMRSFQIPWLPEIRIRSKDFLFFRKLWRNSSKEEVEAYLQIFRRRKSLTAALNYYRANYSVLAQTTSDQIVGEINVPTLFIWGEKDLAVSLAGVEKTHPFVKGPYEFIRLPAGHWLIQSNYEEVSQAIIKHIKTYSTSG